MTFFLRLAGSKFGRWVALSVILVGLLGGIALGLRVDAVQGERDRVELESTKTRLETIEQKKEIEDDVRKMGDGDLRNCVRGVHC